MKKPDKIITSIRLANLLLIIDLHGGQIVTIAKLTGIARSTLSGMVNGKAMSGNYARKLEVALEKPFGWMDKAHEEEELSPQYTKAVLTAAINCIYSSKQIETLYNELNAEGKVDFLDKLYNLFNDPAARKLSPKTILIMLGVEYEIKQKDASTDNRVKEDTQKT